MRLSKLCKGVDLQVEYTRDIEIRGLALDSRKVEPEFLFAALPGTKSNGSSFIPDAITRGATAILSAKNKLLSNINDNAVEVLTSNNPNRDIAIMAANMFGEQPNNIAAVTGTNGKTSVADFTRQIWKTLGLKSASIGTLGTIADDYPKRDTLTTPDAIELHKTLADFKHLDIEHVALEASSHGLSQFRLDGVKLNIAAFTNLSRDHLDYHENMREYLRAKKRLFTDILTDGGFAIINADIPEYKTLATMCLEENKRLISYGENGSEIRLLSAKATTDGQELKLEVFGEKFEIKLPLAGLFQASNALCALAMVITSGGDIQNSVKALEKLTGAPGRLENSANRNNNSSIYVDYAHTPDALETVINSLRPHTKGRLHVVFGCGGDRDKGKRPEMGAIAEKFADKIIVTDDNPRNEDPDTIRAEILKSCPSAKEISDRAKAIEIAVEALKEGDVLLVAGKGHETGQKIAGEIIPFDDRLHCKYAQEMSDFGSSSINSLGKKPVWTSKELVHATCGTTSGEFEAYGVSIDSRKVQKGDIYFALVSENRDGRIYAKHAIEAGAVCVVTDKSLLDIAPQKQVIVHDTNYALEELAKEARSRSNPKVIALSGKLGKSATKKMLYTAISSQASVYAEENIANKAINIPLAMARVPKGTDFVILEMAMGEKGLLKELSALARPDVTIIPNSGKVLSQKEKTKDDITNANAEIFSGMPANGILILNRDDSQFERLTHFAKICGIRDMVSFGQDQNSFVKLINYKPEEMKSVIRFETMKKKYQFEMNVTGRYWAENSVAVIAALHALNLDIDQAIKSLGKMKAITGKGKHSVIPFAGGTIQIIDSSYSATIGSTDMAIKTLSSIKTKSNGRHIMVLGDIDNLGKLSRQQHIELAEKIKNSHIEKVFATGEHMAAMYDKLPSDIKGGYANNSASLGDILTQQIQSGDVICIKGALSNDLSIIIDMIIDKGQTKKMSRTVLF